MNRRSAMGILFRPATSGDATPAMKVFADAVNDLGDRHGFQGRPLAGAPPTPFFTFTLSDQPNGFWVAEDQGEVIGFTISRVYGHFWFLHFLFVSPSCQQRGVGRALLERALGYNGGAAITNRALVTFSYNTTSMSLYMKYGMYARETLYWMAAPAGVLRAGGGGRAGAEQTQLSASEEDLRRLAGIDEWVFGFARDRLHQYFLGLPASSCYFFLNGGAPIGYAYVWANGRVGPLAAADLPAFAAIMEAALSLAAASGAEQVFTVAAGANAQAMSTALSRGLRITSPYLLMATTPFGNWDRYLFHSPGLM